MAVFYSASRRGFFDPAVHQVLPDDAVKITPARHAQLLTAQAQGAQIQPDANGRPQAVFPTRDDMRAALLRDVKREARRRIEAISPLWRQLNDLREGGDAAAVRFARIDAVRGASALIEEQLVTTKAAALDRFPVREHPLWPQTDEDAA